MWWHPCVRMGHFGTLLGGVFFPGESLGAVDMLAGSTVAALSQLPLPHRLLGPQKNLFAGIVIRCLKIESAYDPSPEELSGLCMLCLTSPARPLPLPCRVRMDGESARLPSPGRSATGSWGLSTGSGAAMAGGYSAFLAPRRPVLMTDNGWC